MENSVTQASNDCIQSV